MWRGPFQPTKVHIFKMLFYKQLRWPRGEKCFCVLTGFVVLRLCFDFAPFVFWLLRLCFGFCVCVLAFAFVFWLLRLCLCFGIYVCVLAFAFVFWLLHFGFYVCVLAFAFVFWLLRLCFAPLGHRKQLV